MTKIKILSTAILLFSAIASPVAAQDERGLEAAMGGSRTAPPAMRRRV